VKGTSIDNASVVHQKAERLTLAPCTLLLAPIIVHC